MGERDECFVRGGPVEQVEMVPRSDADALADALESLTTFLSYPGRDDTHQRIGEACGVDLCIVCLAEVTAREALAAYRDHVPGMRESIHGHEEKTDG